MKTGRKHMLTRDQIDKVLRKIIYPGVNRDIMTLGIIKSIDISGQAVSVQLDLRSDDKAVVREVEESIKSKISGLPEVSSVTLHNVNVAKHQGGGGQFLSQIKIKIAVASGKGGVGKSTVSVNLAVALAKIGLKVGLLDSDIYGPSIPLMFGVTEKPEFDGNKLKPIEKYGVKLMSLGFLVTDDSPVIWRGPLVMRALQQLMGDVDWGDLDVILFDMPPGTGDAQLTLSQSVTLDGAVIVTTPQDVALLDAVKGVHMFQKVNVPILGIIENMSYFICGHCQKRTDIFAAGGARRECKRLNVDLLGEIPLDTEIRLGGDMGLPIVEKDPKNEQSKAFIEIAKRLKSTLDE
jgi:ATP-binding protein involved in chromosome partitioning